MMQAWSKSLFMAHRTDPAVLSGITTNPTCIKMRQKTTTIQVHHFIQKIFCWDTSKPRAFLWWHVLLCFFSNSTDHRIFWNPCFPNKLPPIPTEGLIDIFIPSLLNKHSSQTFLKNTALLWALLWMTVHKQSSGQNRSFLLSIYHGTGKAFRALKWQGAVTEVEGNSDLCYRKESFYWIVTRVSLL